MLLSFTALLILVFLLPPSSSLSSHEGERTPEQKMPDTNVEGKSVAQDSVFTEKSANFAVPLTSSGQTSEEKGD